MGYHVTDYHAALDKLTDTPLELTERDFAVLASFNPADEVRGRAALRQAQLAVLPAAVGPLQTKAAPPSRPRGLRPDVLAQHIGETIRGVVLPLRDQVTQLAQRVTELEATTTRQAATMADLRDENKALGKLVTRGLTPPHHAPCLDDLTPGSPKH